MSIVRSLSLCEFLVMTWSILYRSYSGSRSDCTTGQYCCILSHFSHVSGFVLVRHSLGVLGTPASLLLLEAARRCEAEALHIEEAGLRILCFFPRETSPETPSEAEAFAESAGVHKAFRFAFLFIADCRHSWFQPPDDLRERARQLGDWGEASEVQGLRCAASHIVLCIRLQDSGAAADPLADPVQQDRPRVCRRLNRHFRCISRLSQGFLAWGGGEWEPELGLGNLEPHETPEAQMP